MGAGEATVVAMADAPPPQAVASLMSDLKMMCAYETACEWMEPAAADAAFNKISWHDNNVSAAVAKYYAAPPETKARIDYAFNALRPKPADGCSSGDDVGLAEGA